MAPRSRFLPEEVLGLFTRRTAAPNCAADAMPSPPATPVDIGARLRDMWSRPRPVSSVCKPLNISFSIISAVLPIVD